MKFTLKLFLVICLFSSVTFANGDMPGGGFAGDMPGGGFTCTENCSNDDGQSQSSDANSDGSQNDDGSILDFVEDYLFLLFG